MRRERRKGTDWCGNGGKALHTEVSMCEQAWPDLSGASWGGEGEGEGRKSWERELEKGRERQGEGTRSRRAFPVSLSTAFT